MNNIDFENYIKSVIRNDDWNYNFRSYAEENNIPIIRVLSENFLKQIISIAKPIRVLEIGTAIGFSCAVIYKEMIKYTDDPYIISVEKDDNRYREAVENLKKFKVSADLINSDAFETLQDLSSKSEKFDFIFLDGPKAQYITYLPYILSMMKKDSILFVDNLAQEGTICSSRYQIHRRNRTIHQRIREFIYEISNNKELYTSILPLDDGIAICRKV